MGLSGRIITGAIKSSSPVGTPITILNEVKPGMLRILSILPGTGAFNVKIIVDGVTIYNAPLQNIYNTDTNGGSTSLGLTVQTSGAGTIYYYKRLLNIPFRQSLKIEIIPTTAGDNNYTIEYVIDEN